MNNKNQSKNQSPKVTSIAALSEIGKGVPVELSGWTEDAPFVARLRRASLSGMIKAGKIDNPLMAAAQRLYEGPKSRVNVPFEELIKMQHLVVSDALVEPSEAVLKEAGLELTEQQVNEIYNYAIGGAKALERFRNLTEGRDADTHGDTKQGEAERAAGD